MFKISEMTSIQSYVILDLETTGLPSTNYGETKITEISLLGVMKKHFDDSTPFRIPRVVNKLTMCFHPERFISCQSENITGNTIILKCKSLIFSFIFPNMLKNI